VVTALVVGLVSYLLAVRNAEDAALDSLSALATARQTALQQEMDHYREHLEFEFLHGGTRFEIEGLIRGTEDPDSVREAIVRQSQSDSHAQRVDVVDTLGIVRVSSHSAREGRSLADDAAYLLGREGVRPVDLTLDDEGYWIRLAGPILARDDELLAVVIVSEDAGALLSLLGDYTGLGSSGETVLGRRSRDSIEFLAPLRFAPDIQELPSIPTSGDTALPMIHATAGQSGMVRARDYRDAPVVAAYRPLTDSSWGLVVKQDEAEVFAGARDLGGVLALTVSGLLVVGLLLIVPFVRGVTRPIRSLARAADRVAEGQLDVQVPAEGGAEVVTLAASFNRMVHSVRDARDGLTRANDDLERKAQELAEVHGELALYTYAVTHDLRTPLVSIRGMTQLLIEELGDGASEDVRTYLEHIDRSSLRADRLMSDLVTLYRAGRVEGELESVDTGELVREVAEEVRAASSGPAPVVITSPDLPVLEIDRARLYQVLTNLIDNAAKHGGAGPGAAVEVGYVRSASAEGEARHVFSVRDRGRGIPVPDRAKVFDPFFRRPPNGVAGAGLGLTIVRQIVRSLGGEVWIESEMEEGTTVSFSLPAR